MSAEARPDGRGLRLACDSDGCRRTYSARTRVLNHPDDVRALAARMGWTWKEANGVERDECPPHGGGRKSASPPNPKFVESRLGARRASG